MSGKPRQDQPSIALIGLRGCGKSTVGRELVAMIGGKRVDTDDLIVVRAGKSIADIFADEGESGFRRRERAIIQSVVAAPPAVISVGGGAILDERDVSDLRSFAMLVWLTAPAEVLAERIALDPTSTKSRPPLTSQDALGEIESLLVQRAPLYAQAANLTIDSTAKTPRIIAAEIIATLGLPLKGESGRK